MRLRRQHLVFNIPGRDSFSLSLKWNFVKTISYFFETFHHFLKFYLFLFLRIFLIYIFPGVRNFCFVSTQILFVFLEVSQVVCHKQNGWNKFKSSFCTILEVFQKVSVQWPAALLLTSRQAWHCQGCHQDTHPEHGPFFKESFVEPMPC